MGRQLMSGRCLAVAEARTEPELRLRLAQAAGDLGFGLFSATVILDHSGHSREFLNIANAPPAYAPFYDDREGGKRHPVSQHCKYSSETLFWSQEDYLRTGTAPLWEHQAEFGYREGIAVALHLPFRRHFMFGLDSDRPLPLRSHIRKHLAEEFKLLAEYTREAAFRILAPEALDPAPGQGLNAFEVLRWSMDGASPGRVGKLMRLSDADVLYCIGAAMLKLGCTSKHQAVLTAIRRGLLH